MKKGLVLILIVVFVVSLATIAFAGPFADVPANSWAYGAVNQLAKAGIVQGYGDETFRGDKVISRYEMAIIVGKAMEHGDKADDANKALINKLSTEFAQELNSMGVRVSTLETKVKKLDEKSDKLAIGGSFRLRATAADDEIAGVPGNPAPNPSPVKKSYWQMRAMIDLTSRIDDNTTFFASFTNRNTLGGATSSISNANQESAFTKYGVKVKNGSMNYSIGRQDVSLGQGSVINTGFDAAGVDNKFDGLVANFTAGDFKIKAIGGKTTKITTETAAKYLGSANEITEWYGVDATTALSKKLTVGLAAAHSKQDIGVTGISRNYVGVNASYSPSNAFNIKGEYVNSSADRENTAYTVAGTYFWNKDSFTIRYNHVQKFGVDPSNSSIGAWMYPAVGNNMGNVYDGRIFTYMHPINPKTTFTLTFADYTVPGWTGSDKELTSTILWKF